MIQDTPAQAFKGKAQFSLILTFPLAFVISKFFMWNIYGVFDFYTFHLAGVLANSGQVDALYQPTVFMDFFEPTYGKAGLLPWFYPPVLIPYCQFLALFPVDVAYLVNGIISIAIYYAVIKHTFPAQFRDIIILSVLPLIVLLGFGHPSILFLAMIVLGYHFSKYSLWKGLLALTLAAIKPHLGGVVLLLVFMRAPRRSFLPSALIFVSFTGAFSLLYGGEIWLAFLQNLASAASYLKTGTINQQWISSVYGTFITFGASNQTALIAHVLAVIMVVGSTLYVFRRVSAERSWAAIGMGAVFASPYLMYYDIIFLLFPMALVIKSINTSAAKNWIYMLFVGEFAMVAVLEHESLSGMGTTILLSFVAAVLFAQVKYPRSDFAKP